MFTTRLKLINIVRRLIVFGLLLFSCLFVVANDSSVSRTWNETLLTCIRYDLARPTVHARNLFHHSLAMYEAFAAQDDSCENIFLGKNFGNQHIPFNGFSSSTSDDKSINTSINYASHKLLKHRFQTGINSPFLQTYIDSIFLTLGGDTSFKSVNYSTGNAAAFGNYIAQEIISFGLSDGSNEANGYANQYYTPINPPIAPALSGNPDIIDPNRWQQVSLAVQIDQSGNVIPGNTQPFLSPEWGSVVPFALNDDTKVTKTREGENYTFYHDPGPPPYIDSTDTKSSDLYKWGFSLVSIWSSQLTSADTTVWDVSPNGIGNVQNLPESLDDYPSFYNLETGTPQGNGHALNPTTGLPYETQLVKRGDYTRSVAEFWADGPDSETPPGHWFTLLNYIADHPEVERNFLAKNNLKSKYRWELYSYLMLGATMHDVAITTWGMKGYYDYIRPVSALRYMADQGQSSDPNLPNYNVNGIPLVEGYIELVKEGDLLAFFSSGNIDRIKVRAWRGPNYIFNPESDTAGVDWILLEDWWPYQRPSFVTPPFAGYVSGHSTFSSAAAKVLEEITGNAYFPGGLGEWEINKNEFLVFEDGPSESFKLQWATYKDAASQSALSRIWGGIHPPFDDIPGRKIGNTIATDVVTKAENYLTPDRDGDGYSLFIDPDDQDATVYPGAPELCDNKDNDGNGQVDEDLPTYSFFLDADQDGFGDQNNRITSCFDTIPFGYVTDSLDCNDSDASLNPSAAEIADNDIDENCDGYIVPSFVKITPNPFEDRILINAANSKALRFELYSVAGRLVLEEQLEINQLETIQPGNIIPTSGLSDGMYFVRILDEDNNIVHVQKMVKSKPE